MEATSYQAMNLASLCNIGSFLATNRARLRQQTLLAPVAYGKD